MPNHVTNILEFSGDAKKIYDMLSYIKYDDQSLGSFDFNKILPMPKTLNLTSGSTTIDAVNVYMSAINPQNEEDYGVEKVDKETYEEYKKLISQCVSTFPARFNDKMSLADINKESEQYFNRNDRFDSQDTVDGSDIFYFGKTVIENIQNYGCCDWYEWCCCNWGTKWNSYSHIDIAPTETTIRFETAWSAPHPVICALAEKFPDIRINHKWADEDVGNNCGEAEYENGEELSCEYFESSVETTLFAMDILGYDTSDYYITNDGCMIEIGYDFPSSITKTEADDFVAKGMKSEVFEKLGTIHEEDEKDEENEPYFDISSWTKVDITEFLDELQRIGINISDFVYS